MIAAKQTIKYLMICLFLEFDTLPFLSFLLLVLGHRGRLLLNLLFLTLF